MIRSIVSRLLRLSAVVVLLAPPVARAADDTPPNILIILSDDHSAPHLGCYGDNDIHTPNLDRLAAEGIRFDV